MFLKVEKCRFLNLNGTLTRKSEELSFPLTHLCVYWLKYKKDLESFQKRALNWVSYDSNRSYLQQLCLINVLPVPHLMQCTDILLMSKLLVEGEHIIDIPTCNPEYGRSTMFFKLNKGKKEKTCGKFVYRTCRVINRNQTIEFANHVCPKPAIVNLIWKFVDNRSSDSNPCTWQLCCDCGTSF